MLERFYRLFYRLSRCALCRRQAGSALGCCEGCAKTLFRVQRGEDAFVLGPYEGSLRKAVQALKYRQVTRLAGLFGGVMARELKGQGWPLDMVCPVPLHYGRKLSRGYNQAALIAKVVAREAKLPYKPVLKRSRATKRQILLDPEARAGNVAGAFVAKGLQGERVLLVDDVITSGATVTECTLALLQGGASRVYLAAVASAQPSRAKARQAR